MTTPTSNRTSDNESGEAAVATPRLDLNAFEIACSLTFEEEHPGSLWFNQTPGMRQAFRNLFRMAIETYLKYAATKGPIQ